MTSHAEVLNDRQRKSFIAAIKEGLTVAEVHRSGRFGRVSVAALAKIADDAGIDRTKFAPKPKDAAAEQEARERIKLRWMANNKERMATVLQILERGGEMYVQEVILASEGVLTRVYAYELLERMEAHGFIQSRQVPGASPAKPPRRRYRIADLGGSKLAEPDTHKATNGSAG